MKKTSLLLFFLVALDLVHADEAARIKGVTDFLLERANDNWMYVVEGQVKENALLKCYFPRTYAQMSRGNLKILLSANAEIWREVVEDDLNELAERYFIGYVASDKFLEGINSSRDAYIESVLQRFSIKYADRYYPLNQIPIDADAGLKLAINQFSDGLSTAFNALNKIHLAASADVSRGACAANAVTMRQVRSVLKQMETELRSVASRVELLLPNELAIYTGQIPEWNVNDTVIRLMTFDQLEISDLMRVTDKRDSVDKNEKRGNLLHKVLALEDILFRMQDLKIAPFEVSFDSKEYARFRRYVISVAIISDAEEPDQVKTALQEMTLPAVSFGLKRQPGESTVMISSYVGIYVGSERSNEVSSDRRDTYGLFAPLGLEYSRGLSGKRSFSVLLSPVDFAHPINLEIHEREDSVRWEDIVRPSITLAYGFADYPISVGLSAARGKSLMSEDEKETQYSLFLAFDMPLLQLF